MAGVRPGFCNANRGARRDLEGSRLNSLCGPVAAMMLPPIHAETLGALEMEISD